MPDGRPEFDDDFFFFLRLCERVLLCDFGCERDPAACVRVDGFCLRPDPTGRGPELELVLLLVVDDDVVDDEEDEDEVEVEVGVVEDEVGLDDVEVVELDVVVLLLVVLVLLALLVVVVDELGVADALVLLVDVSADAIDEARIASAARADPTSAKNHSSLPLSSTISLSYP